MLNVYNLYYVYVVSLYSMIPKELDSIRTVGELVKELFLPEYIDSFYKWIPVIQIIHTGLNTFHVVFRSHVLARLVREECKLAFSITQWQTA